ncbi:RagB/SusD family nutrient uptake outer membrane protein [Zobellia nedashkovskayae]
MKIIKGYKSFFVLLAIVLLFGCEDYLEKDNKASEFLTQDEVFSDRVKINGIVGRLYDTQEWMFEIRSAGPSGQRRNAEETGKNYGNINLLSGEGISTWSRGPVDAMTLGDFESLVLRRAQNPELDLVWRNSWEAISVANDILDIVDEIRPEVLTEEERAQLKGEAYLFRAFSYHELAKRWGPMPYFKERLDITTNFNLPRPTFAEITDEIVADCDAAFNILPRATWLNDPVNMGRIGKAAALGIKSRHLTIAASPNYAFFDPNNASVSHFGNDSELWSRAAEAAAQLIKYAQGESQVGLYEGDYNLIFHTSAGTIEGLWPRYFPQARPITYRLSWFSKSQGGNYGIGPSQELVDRFETINGLLPADDPNFNEQNPYIERIHVFIRIFFITGPLCSLMLLDKLPICAALL